MSPRSFRCYLISLHFVCVHFVLSHFYVMKSHRIVVRGVLFLLVPSPIAVPMSLSTGADLTLTNLVL